MIRKDKKPKILIFGDYYLPGYKSGGGMRTIVNMVDRLHDRYDFWVVTRDHDGKLDRKRYTTVKINEWNEVRNAKVFYLSKNNIKLSKIRELVSTVQPDSIYTNSYFATLTIYLLKLRKLSLIPNYKIIIAPCGELSEGALQIKSSKKKVFINLAKITGLYQDIIWKASSELEKSEIEKIKSASDKIFIAPDMPAKQIFPEYRQEDKPGKKAGEAKMIFLSRFMRKKNFKWLLENLCKIKGKLVIDIFGPLEDEIYWNECRKIIETLPENIKIEAKGSIPHEEVVETLFQYHFFILPTLGENFGHIFLEAMAAGCPLIISDRTPWINLGKKGIGWEIPLENPEEWVEVINNTIEMSGNSYIDLSSSTRSYVTNWLKDEKIEKETISILEFSLSNALIQKV
ncbi:MAG TPA: glycosyltransferase family 4 protein [Pyrinomonadaceae bacterium]|nr:glycosyltransferase family 4 protein [Pyrinomonadaceae bacterium]